MIELLVVIAIIAVLIALLLPAVQQAREAARRSTCKNILKQWGIALHNYHETYNTLPPGAMAHSVTPAAANPPGNRFGFHVLVLPYIDQGPLYDQFNFNVNFDDPNGTPSNLTLMQTQFPLLFCPSARMPDRKTNVANTWGVHYYGVAGAKSSNPNPYHPAAATTPPPANSLYLHTGTFAGNHGGNSLNGILCVNRHHSFSDITDGSSNTFMMGEISAEPDPLQTLSWRPWTQGAGGYGGGNASYSVKNVYLSIGYSGYNAGTYFNDTRFGSQHTGGTHFLLGDGAVTFVSENIDFATYQALASRDGKEPVQIP